MPPMQQEAQTPDWARNGFVHLPLHCQYFFLIKKVLIKRSGFIFFYFFKGKYNINKRWGF